jgi:hypothetical protein
MKHASQDIKRGEVVRAREIEDLRAAVGWERLPDKYDKILANSYTHFTMREDNELVGFVNVYRDCGFYIFRGGIIDNDERR